MSTILYTSIINKCWHSSENSAWESLVSELREPAPANSHPWLITKKKKFQAHMTISAPVSSLVADYHMICMQN